MFILPRCLPGQSIPAGRKKMIIKVAIADKNKEYIERLVVGLEKYSDISLAVYSDEESLERAFQERKYDVFLFDPDVYMQSAAYFHARADLKILLDDKEKVVADVYANAKRVDKYQRVSKIYKKILELYSEVCGRGIAQENGYTSVVAYYSPVGGAGKTTLALISATKYAMLGKRTFYISFEDVASEDCYLPQDDEDGLSELMCHIERNTNLTMKIQGMLKCKNHNLFYLNHFRTPNDIYDMHIDELQELITAIRNTGLFDVVIVDMGTAMDEKNMVLFEKADRIVIVERTDKISARKVNCFYSQQHIMNEYGNKMVRVINFDQGQVQKIQTEVEIIGKIGRLADSDAGKTIEILAGSSKTQFVTSVV